MKRTSASIALIAVAILCSATTFAASPVAKTFFDRQKKEVNFKKQKSAQRARTIARAAAESNTIYKPLEETYSFYDDEWFPAMTARYTYDDQGRVATVVSFEYGYDEQQNRTSYTYDEFGGITEILEEVSDDGGENWAPSSKYANAYDPIVTDFRTETMLYSWDGEWVLLYGTKYAVTRNSGNVVSGVERLTNYKDEFTPIARLTNTIGTDGKITACKEEELEVVYGDNYTWEEYFDFRDIVWENTDGQLVGFEPENYIVGANRIKSATLFYEDEAEASVEGEYTDELSGRMVINFYLGDIASFEHTMTDEYGSYVEERFVQYEEDEQIFSQGERYEVTFNERGLVTEETSTIIENDEEYAGAVRYEYTIDPDYDAVRETIVSMVFSDDDEIYYDSKITVESFTGLSGIAEVSAESDIACRLCGRSLEVSAPAAAAVSVYTTDGRLAASRVGCGAFSMSLNGLSSGFYIVKVTAGNSVRTLKIALK